ncbi:MULTISPECIES: universal stress protein [Achromobacter]|jgi:nucleotide-binding universal stress UspA family protein|uniref:Universal stress protein n=1 Tax=Achromobacter aegrifaciens TaxID=1287736 RepID=A0AAD2IZW0_ACHAE|nr:MULTISPECIES: universal stress protein [Achromobacter]PTN48489.1 universal stress protein [Achromobacter xylosoxidans]MBD9380276.1 universal stress protein [Achromobacter sp. ACM02]MBD9418649.1 universal stress protein [Achromobacter sp. ACM04]MBD9429036.1 universal stress protein [Achromobacter sp. ACM03]MBD9473728.1 universal stress protein [Achromobacter sp. ACM01]
MYRRISVHLDHGFDCKRRIEAALALAKRHKAELVGIYANAAPPQYYYGESVLMSRSLGIIKELQAQSRDAVETAFLEAAAEADVPAFMRAGTSSPSETVALLGRTTDLIVVSQENREDVEAAHEIEFVEQTLLTAGRPVLAIPSSGEFPVIGDRVLCCWDGSREAARALADAAPILRLASHMTVLSMNEGAASPKHEAPFEDLATYCVAQGMPAPEHVRRDIKGVGVGSTILNAAADHSADLIVMGAYGHSKLRQWALGGATASILKSMTVPVMFSH